MSNYLFFICRWLLLAALLPWALPAAAGPDWLIATGDETAQAGEPLLLEVVKPATLAAWPTMLTLRLTQAGAAQEITLKLTVAETGDKTGDTMRYGEPRLGAARRFRAVPHAGIYPHGWFPDLSAFLGLWRKPA